MGVCGQRHAPAALYSQEISPVPIVQEAGWASEPVWTQGLEEKPFVSAGDRNSVVHFVVRHYSLLTELPQLLDAYRCIMTPTSDNTKPDFIKTHRIKREEPRRNTLLSKEL
jgi:hypothetical protein